MSEYEPYSPQLRTALVLTGVGTAGAYHAGALRALHDAGVKIDIVAGRGVGVIGALFVAVDGAQRLWDERGLWRSSAVRSLYDWRAPLKIITWALGLSTAAVALPLAAMAAGLVVFPIDFLARMVGVGGTGGLVGAYIGFAQALFAPDAMPTWLPRAVFLLLLAAAAVAALDARRRASGRVRGSEWWRLLGSPLDSRAAVDQCWSVLWELLRGAAQLKQPSPRDLARRYTELLADNLGQPGFRELVVTAHDLDAHRDLVFALVAETRRRDLIRRPTIEEADRRRAEVLDLSGVAREHLADAVAGALSIPIATDPGRIQFAPDAFWRGETHRLADRPGGLLRLLTELVGLGVEQFVIVSAAPESSGPHALGAARVDARGRLGEALQSGEAAAVRDATTLLMAQVPRVFTIRPDHNPVGPFDFGGGYDERSARRHPLDELINCGYEDAYRQFVEPVVAASGDRVGQPA